MFALRAAPEVATDHEDRPALEARVVERMNEPSCSSFVARVFEGVLREIVERHRSQEAGWNDAIRVHVFARQ